MRTITATEAARRFSDLLDAIERGEVVTVTRGHKAIAEVRPAQQHTGRELRAALASTDPPDEQFVADVAGALALLTSDQNHPWADD